MATFSLTTLRGAVKQFSVRSILELIGDSVNENIEINQDIYDLNSFQELAANTGGGLVNIKSIPNGQNYTLTAADSGALIYMPSTMGTVLWVPTGLPVGFNCTVMQGDNGSVAIAADNMGVSIRQANSLTHTGAKYAIVSIVSFALNQFVLQGNMS